jgi:phosphoglycerol transferase MdoB-like AlkP superfamily enzyme
VLHRAGYRQVFVEGSDLDFENFRSTFQSWEFDELLGRHELDRDESLASSRGGWGYYDSALMKVGLAKLTELSRSSQRFNLACSRKTPMTEITTRFSAPRA